MNALINRVVEDGRDILVIDDTPDNLRFLSSLLTEAGYTVRKVINGELGLEAAKLQPPDLILLDIMMPGMNGYEVCQRMKTSDRTRDVPIIFLSALDEELEKVQAFQIGGVDYVTKPFQVVEVLARIETHLKISRLQQQLQQQNLQLQQEMAYRTSAEAALQLLNQGIDAHVQEHTTELKAKTERLLHRQKELQAALEQEEKLNAVQSQAIETLAQGLQNPLNDLENALDRLQKELPEHLSANLSVQQIVNSILQIEQLISKALSSVKPIAKELCFNPVLLDFTRFCRNIVNQWQLPEDSPHSLNFLPVSQAPTQVFADPGLLQQLLTILISNAIQFSPNGGTVEVELGYEPRNVQLYIRDQGIGIPPDEIQHIFDRLYCASNAGRLAGSGMSLAKAKQIVERHRGTITVESEIGKGTSFTVTLPL